MEDWRRGGFGLYIHWPFCQSKCPYCDFNSHVAEKVDQKRWLAAYLGEIDRCAKETPGRVLESVFFGGGTPSLMQPEIVAEIIASVRRAWPMRNDPEITLEANPGSIEAGRFQAYRQGGVNRISMGMQAMNDADLRRLGRLHTTKEAIQAFDIARNNFERVSFDLIYARQSQTIQDWTTELQQALAMAVDHVSLYQLTIEPGTAFGDRFSRGRLRGLPDEDLSADMYLATQEICGAAGFPSYEVSNHAREGAESRHNLIYWRGGDYIGIGPGAHGRLTLNGNRWATEAPRAPGQWLAMAEKNIAAELPRELLSTEEHVEEYLLMGLRLSEGLNIDRIAAILERDITGVFDQLLADGLATVDRSALKATAKGRLLLNEVIRRAATCLKSQSRGAA